jgi:predicted NAD-dependent protein-ADP-ribosyltransferase YbiA (DUF1768 family)
MTKRNVKQINIPVNIRNRMENIYSYIKYCQNLETAYKNKHEEVRTLNNYLIRIQKVMPENVSKNCPEVNDIINYIEGIPSIPDTEKLNRNLQLMIDEQAIWKDQSDRNYNLINRKIGNLSETSEFLDVGNDSQKPTNLQLDGINIIPFFKENDNLTKYGGSFLSSYYRLKNPISLKFREIGELKFNCVYTAYLSGMSRYIKDKVIKKDFLVRLTKDILSFQEIKNIKKKFMVEIIKNPDYKKDWELKKYKLMKFCTFKKFELNPDLKVLLKKTAESYLLQHSPDNYWGDNSTDTIGKNMMGKLLMELRKKFFGTKNNFKSLNVGELRKLLNTSSNGEILVSGNEISKNNTKRNIKINSIRKTKKKQLGKKK